MKPPFLLLIVLLVALYVPARVDAAEPLVYTGIFLNETVERGGDLALTLTVNQGQVQTRANFTALVPSSAALCGAGETAPVTLTMPFTSTFVSRDLDLGCGFDWGATYTLTSTLQANQTQLVGTFAVRNSGGSLATPAQGRFEAWRTDVAPVHERYLGTFVNTTIGAPGTVALQIQRGEQLVAGTIDFDGLPGGQVLCGGGTFVVPVAEPLRFTPDGGDRDLGCGLSGALVIELVTTDNGAQIIGTYRGGVQAGTLTLRRARVVALPALRR